MTTLKLARPIYQVFRRLGPKGATLTREQVLAPDITADTADAVPSVYPVAVMPMRRARRFDGGTMVLGTADRWQIAAWQLPITPEPGDVLTVDGQAIVLGPDIEHVRAPDGTAVTYTVQAIA